MEIQIVFAHAIVLLMVFVVSSCREYKIGMLVQTECCHWTSMYRVGGAINIAMDHLREDQVINDANFSIVMRDTRDESDGVGNVVAMVKDDDVDVILGSPSSPISVPAAHLTSNWNFPHISWLASSTEFADKDRFTTFVRTMGPYSKIGIAFVAIFERFGWKRVGLLHVHDGTCLYASDGIVDSFREANITVAQRIEYKESELLPSDIDRYLTMLKLSSRIIVMCDFAHLFDYMIRACEMDMCTGDYVFLFPSMTISWNFDQTQPWKIGKGRDQAALHALRYLLFVTLANWYGQDGREKYVKFMEDVIQRTIEPPWNEDYAKRNNISASSVSQNMYDAMYFYGLWINHTISTGQDHRDGRAMLEFSDGLSFISAISGPCHFDMGDRVPLYWIWDFTHPEGYPTIAAIANTEGGKHVLEDSGYWKGFEWQTIDGNPPPDTPRCGFYHEFCRVVRQDNSIAIVISCLLVAVITTVSSIAVYIYRFWEKYSEIHQIEADMFSCSGSFRKIGFRRKRKFEINMMRMIWKVEIGDIELQKARAGLGSRITLNAIGQQKKSQLSLTLSESGVNVVSANPDQALTTVALCKGQMVAIKPLPKVPRDLTRNDLLALKEMREMLHNNINPFIGACIEPPSPCALFIYCTKGSLQDILENDDIVLDLVFKNSLMLDLAEGLYFLHCSCLKYHGRLKSSNCLVDSRWVLKITDYGMTRFFDNTDFSKMEENQYYKSLLWTAPELLSTLTSPIQGSKQGDVYSFGIILHEIFFRMGTFAGQPDIIAKNLVEQVQKRMRNPCRPKIYTESHDVTPAVVKLMQLCWSDNELERPTFRNIRHYIKKNIHGINKNIVDIMLQRLEKYASNLEELVDQRTQELIVEKQKTDTLLYRMLPPIYAEQLKAGEVVQPELFESATVFFSDIVGFTSIAAKSSPIQVIDLLNDLYTCFDSIISKHDAYKVETIGDAYLVVSGIPTRNGKLHAVVIADMALQIIKALTTFKLRHLPGCSLSVRIGIHTGPCCAGVVGLSMPRYCLFGDTVNTASRMESTGMENKIQISEAACEAIQELGGYNMSFRGEMDIKGKGLMRTYWLDGKIIGNNTASKLSL